MNIYINGRFLEDNISGIGKFALSIINQIDRQNIENVILLIPPKVKNDFIFENIKVKSIGFFSGNIWEQLELPYYSYDGVLLSLCSRGPAIKKKQLLTIHDAATEITPDRFPLRFRLMIKFLYIIMKNRVGIITTVSKKSREDIVDKFNISAEKIRITYNGIDKFVPDNRIIEQLKLNNIPFILSVGGTENKNIEGIVSSLKYIRNDIKYVCVGELCKKYHSLVKENERIIETGYIKDEELFALYRHAICLVFPSFYEGFGIPPLEAMSMGCPVVSSNISALKEIYGDSVLYCNPNDSADIADNINKLVNNVYLKEKLIDKSLACLKKYSWKESADKIIKWINEIA